MSFGSQLVVETEQTDSGVDPGEPFDVHHEKSDVGEDIADPQLVVEGERIENARSVVEYEHVRSGQVTVSVQHVTQPSTLVEQPVGMLEI